MVLRSETTEIINRTRMERQDVVQASEGPWWRRAARDALRSYLVMSVAAYVLLGLLAGAVLFAIERSERRYIDTLYSAVSALTVTGA